MKRIIHRSAAIIAMLCIATFFISSIAIELLGSNEGIATIKSLIVLPGLFILLPCIMITGATGFALSKNRSGNLISNKKKRMPLIAVNGIFILIPAAIFLNQSASSGDFGSTFYIVQSVELIAGALNLFLMGLNMRDGLKLSGKLRSK